MAVTDNTGIQSKGFIQPKKAMNDRTPFEHQQRAMEALDKMNTLSSFSTMVVLPTGGGKTFTASNWLLKNALNKGKKILWIAHRHLLLDQAAQSFEKYAYAELMPDIRGFNYRIVSGKDSHCRASDIKPNDDIVIASKDSLRSKPEKIKEWLKEEDEVFLVVDEAHHATAKTYRKLVDLVKESVPRVKIIGLTATPFRTLESERGLLSKVFKDGIVDGRVVQNESGICYQIGLQELISRQILSRPVMKEFETNLDLRDTLGQKEIDEMQRLDSIPDKVARQMIGSRNRNSLIVDTYKKEQQKYGKTILFALNIAHAHTLQKLFEKHGIKSDYVVSRQGAIDSGKPRSNADNIQAVEKFRNGDTDVLINVNILTEGVDLPQTQSVFLTRPTASSILMTQMIGRALRGTKSGGTAESYIVSFVDDWDEKVAWVNPETLFTGAVNIDNKTSAEERTREDVRTIALSKIREFASILDESVDTKELEAIPFIERIPVGMYVFRYTEQGDAYDKAEGSDISCQVMVYSSTQSAYESYIESLPHLVAKNGLEDEEYASEELLQAMIRESKSKYFRAPMVPPYQEKDLVSILKYFLQFGEAPIFYPFEEIDRNRLDVSIIAKDIVDRDLSRTKQSEYEESLWNDGEENLLRLFFGDQRNFTHAIDIEIRKIINPDLYAAVPKVMAETDGGFDFEERDCEEGAVNQESDNQKQEAVMTDSSASESVIKRNSLSPVRVGLDKYFFGELCPTEDVVEQMPRYAPKGVSRNPVTGEIMGKFGDYARVFGDGNEALYSFGYRVAEFANGKLRLLEYEIDGEQNGWRVSKRALNHVQDYVAAKLSLDRALPKEELEQFSVTVSLDDGKVQASDISVQKIPSLHAANSTFKKVAVPTAVAAKDTSTYKVEKWATVQKEDLTSKDKLQQTKNLRVFSGTTALTIDASRICVAKPDTKNRSRVYMSSSATYTSQKSFDSLKQLLTPIGFILANPKCLVRPSAITKVYFKGAIVEADVVGQKQGILINEHGLKLLKERRPSLFAGGGQ